MSSASSPALRRPDDLEVGPVLGSGGMATVYLGQWRRQAGFSRPVAVKVLHPHHAADVELVQLFLQEAQLVARVRHPNVVTPLDLFVAPAEVMMVMEYVHGVTLSELARVVRARATSVPPAIACAIVSAALEGLHAAHELRDEAGAPLQPVHRDVSPQNVMVGANGEVKVLDFGVAKVVGLAPSTRTGRIKGKLAYMAPEQLQGERLDRRADVYGVGVVLWELLAGRPLFYGESEGHVVTQVLSREPPAPSAFSTSEAARALDSLVLRALSKAPGPRFATAREMALALEAAVPPASPRALGEWIRGHAGEALAAKEALVVSLGGGGARNSEAAGRAPAAAHLTAATAPFAAVTPTQGRASGGRISGRRTAGLFAALALAGVSAGGAFWSLAPRGEPQRSSAPPRRASVEVVPAVAPAPAPLPVTSGTETPAEVARAPLPAAEQRPQPAPISPNRAAPASTKPRREGASGASARRRSVSKDRGAAASRKGAAAPRDAACDDPYVWRGGIKYPKPECF